MMLKPTFNLQGSQNYHSYLMESMPSVSELGLQHTSFPIYFGGAGGYEVRVIAAEDNTGVSIPALSIDSTLNLGEFLVADNTATRFAFEVSCTKPCLAVQYMRNLPQSETKMSAFMAVLTPDETKLCSSIFTVPTMVADSDVTAAISIITNEPTSGLLLNGNSLTGWDWQPVSTKWYATNTIGPGFHELQHQAER